MTKLPKINNMIQSQSSQIFYEHENDNDTIFVSRINNFETSEKYYQKIFAALCFSTGNKNRLNRITFMNIHYQNKRLLLFDVDENAVVSDNLAIEYLISELGSLFICNNVNIPYYTVFKSNIILKKWLVLLNKEPLFLYEIIDLADKAAKFVLKDILDEQFYKDHNLKK